MTDLHRWTENDGNILQSHLILLLLLHSNSHICERIAVTLDIVSDTRVVTNTFDTTHHTKYQLCINRYKCLHGMAHLSDLCRLAAEVLGGHHLHSASRRQLHTPVLGFWSWSWGTSRALFCGLGLAQCSCLHVTKANSDAASNSSTNAHKDL